MKTRTQMRNMRCRVQRGFTLVELAIVLVIAGLILVAVLRGTDAIQKAQVERMVSDLRGLQGILLEFQKRNGRLPGDCDNNGVKAHRAIPEPSSTYLPMMYTPVGSFSILDYTNANRSMPAVPVGDPLHASVTCTDTDSLREWNINLVWNELRRAGLVDSHRLPRELARHSMGDVFEVKTMFDTDDLGGQRAGVIVVYGIPVWMAEAVDSSIDGTATTYGAATASHGPASTGRVRIWHGAGGTPLLLRAHGWAFRGVQPHHTYDQGLADRDRLISISFQYTPNKLIR